MQVTVESDEITQYIIVTPGYTVRINGTDYVVAHVNDGAIEGRERREDADGRVWVAEDLTEIAWMDVRELHIY